MRFGTCSYRLVDTNNFRKFTDIFCDKNKPVIHFKSDSSSARH